MSVSTHAPLAGSDVKHSASPLDHVVSTHAPLAGSDEQTDCGPSRPHPRFNPRSPCGERLPPVAGDVLRVRVSTHAPLAGSDIPFPKVSSFPSSFQPTLPLRGATGRPLKHSLAPAVSTHAPLAGSDVGEIDGLRHVGHVSTHAPLAGSDERAKSACVMSLSFQPTLPLRGATYREAYPKSSKWFQPTLPLRGATGLSGAVRAEEVVSTHAPLAGSDARRESCARRSSGFNPRSPCGERRDDVDVDVARLPVSTHAPLAGSDR